MSKHHKSHAVEAPHEELSSHAPEVKGDSLVHASHHAANKEHGLPAPFGGESQYQNGGTCHHLGDNAEED